MDDLSAVLGALSHPARRQILSRLAERPARVTEIAAPFRLSLNAVSKHLKVLEAAGLISRQKRGREHLIEFKAQPLHLVSEWVHPYQPYWSDRLDRLEAHFRKPNIRNP